MLGLADTEHTDGAASEASPLGSKQEDVLQLRSFVVIITRDLIE